VGGTAWVRTLWPTLFAPVRFSRLPEWRSWIRQNSAGWILANSATPFRQPWNGQGKSCTTAKATLHPSSMTQTGYFA